MTIHENTPAPPVQSGSISAHESDHGHADAASQPSQDASTEEHPLPWYVMSPYNGCDGTRLQHSVWDAEGTLIAECFGDDEGRTVALAICTAVNLAGPKVCECGRPAACFGAYEDGLSPAYACDECCGHGCEDGHCESVSP